MSNVHPPVLTLAETVAGQETDWFLCLTRKEEHRTREGKPYLRITVRDASREVTLPIWHDSPWFHAIRNEWHPGTFYKVRGQMQETNFGPQLEIHRWRPASDADQSEGFDPLALLPRTRFDVVAMYARLVTLVETEVRQPALRGLVLELLSEHREVLCELPAAVHHHHAYRGGFLEHLLSVAENAVFLARKYGDHYPDHLPPERCDLVVAGAVLHDIGKLQELVATPVGAAYTAEGELIGHALLGRDLVRSLAARHSLPRELQLRLEHILISHQRTQDWGAAKPPMTLEALLVFYADDLDARLQMMVEALQTDTTSGLTTSTRNALQQKVFRGPVDEPPR
jgi:3'-5' exoribonuclease